MRSLPDALADGAPASELVPERTLIESLPNPENSPPVILQPAPKGDVMPRAAQDAVEDPVCCRRLKAERGTSTRPTPRDSTPLPATATHALGSTQRGGA
jgi:hypothetical protein